ncbi:MAG: lysylphosphatidylglycerol synthase transmembrane domain-containing protein [Gemmatimonadota bacterium]
MPDAAPKSHRAWVPWLTGLFALAALVIVVSRRGEELRFADLLRHARPGWLALALVCQVGTYACAAGAWQRVLARQRIRTSLPQLIPLGLAKLFMDQVAPSAGLSGTMLVVRALKRRGVPDKASSSAVLVGLLGFHVAYAVALVLALVLLAVSGHLGPRTLIIAGLATLLIGIVIGGLLWLARGKRGGRVRGLLMRIPGLKGFLKGLSEAPKEALHDRRLLAETTALQFGIFVLDAATLSICLLALDTPANIAGVFAALVIASLVATITLIPSGLGTFDATMLGLLRVASVPATAAIGAVVLFRGFTLMLPLLPGLWLARREMRGSKGPRARAT